MEREKSNNATLRGMPKGGSQTGSRTDDGLTQQQEAFCLAFVETGKGSEAYRRAYKPRRMTAKSVHEKASHILADGKVQARVAELRERAAGEAVFGLVEHLAELARLKQLAEADKNFPAAVRAEELRGKVAGFYVERTMTVNNPLDQFKHEELRALYNALTSAPPPDVVH